LAHEGEPIQFEKLWKQEYKKSIKKALKCRGALRIPQLSAGEANLIAFKQLYTAWRIMWPPSQQLMVNKIYFETQEDLLVYQSLDVLTGRVSSIARDSIRASIWYNTGFSSETFGLSTRSLLTLTDEPSSKYKTATIRSYTQWWMFRCDLLRDEMSVLNPAQRNSHIENCAENIERIQAMAKTFIVQVSGGALQRK
jgi:hypothetical protein